ncbi:hypothetical protein C0992_012011 [Termitomyces sp. T32_za158]|nr:hypothetical protein C0992_012011 [Termitomyces sp. T32_za158]
MALMIVASAEGEGPLRKGLSSFAFFRLNDIQDAGASTVMAKIEKDANILRSTSETHPGLQEQIDMQLENLHSKESPDIEIASIPMLFSPTDMDILIQGIKYTRTMAQTEPMKSAYVGDELQPGSLYASDEELREYIKDTLATSWHSLGTCSMLPKEKQGVVDPELKVHGAKNLRIADISIIPLQIAAHTQAIAYIVGEKGGTTIIPLFV